MRTDRAHDDRGRILQPAYLARDRRPISPLSPALTALGAVAPALPFASLSRRLPADGACLVRAHGKRQPGRVGKSVGVLDDDVGRKRADALTVTRAPTHHVER